MPRQSELTPAPPQRRAALVIVSRDAGSWYERLRQRFADDAVQIVFDRRHGERRQADAPSPVERRRSDRRRYDVSRLLREKGWAVVPLPPGQSTS